MLSGVACIDGGNGVQGEEEEEGGRTTMYSLFVIYLVYLFAETGRRGGVRGGVCQQPKEA